jgi:O-acetyl-ADP-ribose deacetylase (regulator of RNase III)
MQSEVLASVRVCGCLIEAVLGDITEQQVDAVVNAANSHLRHGGGLAAAIVRRGGRVIQEESDRVAPVPVGGAAVTTAGELPCRWVVHAVGPRWGEGDEESKLRSAVRSCLEEATRRSVTSLAMPAISTGIFGYPKAEGTACILDEIGSWLTSHPESGLQEIRLTAFDATTAALFASAVSACNDG